MKTLFPTTLLTIICLAFTGCQSYDPLPFDPAIILKELKAARNRKPDGPVLTFRDAARLMDAGNLELKEIRAKYRTLKAVADIPTPLSNPEIEAGPAIGHRLGDVPRSVVQPFVALGFSIPLGPRLSREDDLNAIRAQTAKVAVSAKHRDLFLALRNAYVAHALASTRQARRATLTEVIKKSDETSLKLEEAGTIGKLELNQGYILNRLEDLGRLDDELESEVAAAALGELLGLGRRAIVSRTVEDLPTLPARLPSMDALEGMVIEHNTELSALRMAFWETDAQLRLELAKQYPDLNLGFGFEQEPGGREQTFEIGIGLELPFFDRNKQAIAQAIAERIAAKAAYEAKLGALLTRLELGVRTYDLHSRKQKELNRLLPLAAKNQEDAHRLTELGTFDFMRYLDVSKAYAELTLEDLEQTAKVWDALSTVEAIAGFPIVPLLGVATPAPKTKD